MQIVRSSSRLVVMVSVIVISVVSHSSLQIVTSSDVADEYPDSEFSQRQDEDLNRIERLEARVSHLVRDVDRFRNLNQDCRCQASTTNKSPATGAEAHPLGHHRATDPYGRAKTMPEGGPPAAGGPRASIRRRSPVDDTRLASADRQANFLRGEPGRNGLDGVPGLDGAPGLDGVPGMDGRNGRDGADGHDGKDGKDGMPGERGPIGPPGPPGEPGKRGKPGPPGKTGAPGQPGVCAYKAKYDCQSQDIGSGSAGTNNSMGGLLLAPTMIGQLVRGGEDSGDSPFANQDERQVTVNEGDNIQLSCEAYGLPKPDYIWHRTTINNIKSTILMDVVRDLQVTSYPGSQLPLFGVDRVQSGNYECIASNGVPPPAIKRINLDVNYAPTVRLYPGPSIHKVKLGSSLLAECLVDANPSPFTYWMFGSELIMSIAAPSGSQAATTGSGQAATGSDEPMPTLMAASKLKKYTITESTGQLSTGAYYTIVTLNVANINLDDLGLYKCVSKNLIGQTVGYLWLESSDGPNGLDGVQPSSGTDSDGQQQRKFRDIILERGSSYERFDHTLGWPTYLTERDPAATNYSIFDNEAGGAGSGGGPRRQLNPDAKRSLLALNGFVALPSQPAANNRKVSLDSVIQEDQNGTDPIKRARPLDGTANETHEVTLVRSQAVGKSDDVVVAATNRHQIEPDELLLLHTGAGRDQGAVLEEDGLVDETELCRIESHPTATMAAKHLPPEPEAIQAAAVAKTATPTNRSNLLLLDQVGKPVYVGSITSGLLNWWSMDSRFRNQVDDGELTNNDLVSFSLRIYATSPNKTLTLYEYKGLPDLLKDQQMASIGSPSPSTSLVESETQQYSLKHPIVGNSHLVYGRQFIYITESTGNGISDYNSPRPGGSLRDLMVVILDLSSGNQAHLKMDDKMLWQNLENQPRDLGPEYKLNRLELASDENGVWLIVPTFERPLNRVQQDDGLRGQRKLLNTAPGKQNLIRRLHVFKLNWSSQGSGPTEIQIDYHVSMKLDWRMIGQLFIIDGVLYGIKDRNLYSSKLQFAYDLYRCKLLSTEYLNEPHRTFTNHFGNTQMIKYNPNEPKRLYTIDNGNLLWCPVKLIQIDLTT